MAQTCFLLRDIMGKGSQPSALVAHNDDGPDSQSEGVPAALIAQYNAC